MIDRCAAQDPGALNAVDAEPRDLLHSRDIILRGYRRADGLYDIEAQLTDTKSYGSANRDRGYIQAGEPVHALTSAGYHRLASRPVTHPYDWLRGSSAASFHRGGSLIDSTGASSATTTAQLTEDPKCRIATTDSPSVRIWSS